MIAPFRKIRGTFDTTLQSPIVQQPSDFAREPGYRRQDNKRFSPNPDISSVQAVSGSKFFALRKSKLYVLQKYAKKMAPYGLTFGEHFGYCNTVMFFV
ncbi:MAG: hypothetical protein CSA20_03080 [Deltaproteobacteria bacterium]|nr:MAG: hypothetical protein CSA20_03080 [Deltaproteobacteria bacterium]